MVMPLPPLPLPRLTIDMLDDLPDDGTRYELLEGVLLVTPAPRSAIGGLLSRCSAPRRGCTIEK